MYERSCGFKRQSGCDISLDYQGSQGNGKVVCLCVGVHKEGTLSEYGHRGGGESEVYDVRYLSLFSGIEACTVAWHPLGWKAVAFAEFDDFPKAVLKYHYPNIPDLGDVTKITAEDLKKLGPFELLVGGSPCQDLSVAGKRAGLRNEDGSLTRSGLFDHQMRIFELARKINGCRFCLWENVPGAFSSNDGQDFAYVLGTMVQGSVSVPRDGWGNSGVVLSQDGKRCVEWRVLDAQYMGVPQRRRRVFALLDSGTWWSRPPVLFEPKGVSGNFESGGEAQESFTGRAYAGSDEDSKGLFADIIRTSIPREDESDEDEEY